MKILIIRMFPSIPNINTYNMQEIGLAKALIRQGHLCDIIYYNANNEEKVEKYEFDKNLKFNIYWLPGKDFFGNAIYSKKLFEIVKKYDVVQSSEYNQIFNVKLYKKIQNKLIIYHGPYYNRSNIKDNIKSYIFDIYINLFYRKYKNIWIMSKSELAKEFLTKKGYKNIKNVGVGIDKERLENNNLKQSNFLNTKDKIILYIGQIEKRRNVDFIIKVYDKVRNKNKNTKLIIIGNGKESYKEKCKKLIVSKGLQDNVIMIKKMNQEEIGNLYNIASVFLLATSYEIFGMVLLEAMLYGIPTITTYNGGSSTLIENEKNGYICNTFDENIWSNKIIEILNKNNIEISQNAKRTIEDKFTWNVLSKEFIETYRNSIGKSKSERKEK